MRVVLCLRMMKKSRWLYLSAASYSECWWKSTEHGHAGEALPTNINRQGERECTHTVKEKEREKERGGESKVGVRQMYTHTDTQKQTEKEKT